MTPEERVEKRKQRAEAELRRQVNREVRKRKLVPLETKKTKKSKTATGAASASADNKTATDKKYKTKIRTYFGHVPKPAEDGGPPPLPTLPPEGWAKSSRQVRIEAARRAAEYYGRMANAWEDIAQGEFRGQRCSACTDISPCVL